MRSTDFIPRTALDVFKMLPEGTRCEVLNNVLYMSPSPTYNHQSVVGVLQFELMQRLRKKAEVLHFLDTYFESLQSAVQPDLLVILKENAGIIQPDGIYGPPDVVIEILSVENNRDTLEKKAVYEKAGVKEYFVVEQHGLDVTGFLLEDGIYRQHFNGRGLFKSTILDVEFSFSHDEY